MVRGGPCSRGSIRIDAGLDDAGCSANCRLDPQAADAEARPPAARLGVFGTDQGENIRHRRISQRLQFFGSAVLDRVRHEMQSRAKPYRLRLRRRGRLEFYRRHRAAWNSAPVELRDVMQTARRARASIGQAFDDDVTALDDILDDVHRRRLRMCRLGKAQYVQAVLGEAHLDAVEELLASLLGDAEQADRRCLQVRRRRHPLAHCRRRLSGRVAHQIGLVPYHSVISFVTTWISFAFRCPVQPPMMADMSPPRPPARTSRKFSRPNLSTRASPSAGSTATGT